MVGVVDYAKQKEQRKSYNSGNAMCYIGNGGYKYPSEGSEGGGFSEGDVVEVDVNRATSTIKYIINGVTKATHNNNMLADNSRVFMAYVEMCDTGDIVEWLLWMISLFIIIIIILFYSTWYYHFLFFIIGLL